MAKMAISLNKHQLKRRSEGSPRTAVPGTRKTGIVKPKLNRAR
jgi:hypothetical protein